MMLSMRNIIGIDEVGRGCLAGPVLVAALVLPRDMRFYRKNMPRLRDSKKLSASQRQKWFQFLKNHPKISFATARVLPHSIDKINITSAANRAATRAFAKLTADNPSAGLRVNRSLTTKARVYLDGGLYISVNPPSYPCKSAPRTLVRGDEKINAIKLASIVAKVTRDKYMVRLHKRYPAYGFDKHKGYGTLKHRRAIQKHGLSEIHRRSFCTRFA